jgi:hypothetical protein
LAALDLLIVTPQSWLADWAWGLPLIVMTVVIHVLGLRLINERVERLQKALVGRHSYRFAFVAIISAAAWLASILHGIDALIWAVAYRFIGALPDYSSGVLYSLGAMTTFGHANLFLEKRWELIGALEALDGMLLFGLTTAVLIHIIKTTQELSNKKSSFA